MPEIAIITPSFNQGQFIQRTIDSVLNQEIADLEYVVVDGGSKDNTIDVLKSYSEKIQWVSERDEGQTHAVNKGLAMTSAPIIGWLNSDDIYYPHSLTKVLNFFNAHPEVDVVYGDAYHIDTEDKILEKYYTQAWDAEKLKEICFICQPALFFRRRAVEQYGKLNQQLQYSMDYEYWLRLAKAGAVFAYLPEILAGSRLHADTKTLGSRVKVHKEINDMLRMTLQRVPDRWLSNYAHALVETNIKPSSQKSLRRRLGWQTILASLRWNWSISPRLLRTALGWMLR